MEKYIVQGGTKLSGTVSVSGAKNVALKALVAACLTDEEVVIKNAPLISDISVMIDIIRELGGTVTISDHELKVQVKQFAHSTISLDQASHIRTSSMFLAPLLIRTQQAVIPNPGGCRIGARPIDRTVEGLIQMGADIDYMSEDGYFHATAHGLHGVTYRFEKNTHTGTETLIIAAVLATGKTILENAAEEPEIDELIELLNAMGAKIKRTDKRTIEIEGVTKLHAATCTIRPDRNEIVTFAIAAFITKGDVLVQGAKEDVLQAFLMKLDEIGAGYEVKNDGIRFFYQKPLQAASVTTAIYPGFMTDWQAPWAVLMTQAEGESTVHETVFSNRFGYVSELRKMGAKITFIHPEVANPQEVYNFDPKENEGMPHAIAITGPSPLHDAVVQISDLRAGASLVLAALAAKGATVIHGVSLIDRGYESFEERLHLLGANIKRVNE
ncbi:MAG TPA: UDP-N-acetylglucosamine 1-carboxyvinyltransferase [Patescibacteria group bacterium]|nr:UDP-N-acetylglucosamine 1-carboxyvinyltransferase [Patescibacteria group bacterium]